MPLPVVENATYPTHEEIRDGMIAEIETGADGTGVRCGVIKVGTSNPDNISVGALEGAMTGDGDDIITVDSMSFAGIDAGRGTDTLRFAFAGQVNTSLLAPTALTNIEVMDLTYNAAANELILTPDKVKQMTDEDNPDPFWQWLRRVCRW